VISALSWAGSLRNTHQLWAQTDLIAALIARQRNMRFFKLITETFVS
jgi:hypothetical protein